MSDKSSAHFCALLEDKPIVDCIQRGEVMPVASLSSAFAAIPATMATGMTQAFLDHIFVHVSVHRQGRKGDGHK